MPNPYRTGLALFIVLVAQLTVAPHSDALVVHRLCEQALLRLGEFGVGPLTSLVGEHSQDKLDQRYFHNRRTDLGEGNRFVTEGDMIFLKRIHNALVRGDSSAKLLNSNYADHPSQYQSVVVAAFGFFPDALAHGRSITHDFSRRKAIEFRSNFSIMNPAWRLPNGEPWNLTFIVDAQKARVSFVVSDPLFSFDFKLLAHETEAHLRQIAQTLAPEQGLLRRLLSEPIIRSADRERSAAKEYVHEVTVPRAVLTEFMIELDQVGKIGR